MSSDDYGDIIKRSRPRMRTGPLPHELLHIPEIPFEIVENGEYDFIIAARNANKPKRVPKPKAPKNAREKKSTDSSTKPPDKKRQNTGTENPESSTNSYIKPLLSPISQMIYEMDQKNYTVDDGKPVSTRTRSSLNANQTSIFTTAVETPKSPPKKRITRSGKSKSTAASMTSTHTFMTDFINLDSDDENIQPSVSIDNKQKPIPKPEVFEMENAVVELNLYWHGEMQSYQLRKHQKFSHFFNEIAERNGVPLEEILVNTEDHMLEADETPDMIGLKVYHILHGRAVKVDVIRNVIGIKPKEKPAKKESYLLMRKPKNFQLKVQMGTKREKPMIISMKRTDCFNILYIKCAEELNCKPEKLKLFFDGEMLEINDTPERQDMEGNEIIDLRLET